MNKLFFLALLFFALDGLAQTHPTIRSGRPGQSIDSNSVGKNIIQIQSGVSVDDTQSADRSVLNNLLRFGVSEAVELNGAFDYVSTNNDLSGVDNIQLGGRVKVIDSNDQIVESLNLQFRTRLKGSGDFKRDRQSFNFISSAQLKSIYDFSFTINLGLENDGADPYLNKLWTFSISRDLTENLSLFIEPYGTKSRDSNVLSLNTGLSYLFSKNISFDFSFGRNISDGNYKFVSSGISARHSMF